MINGFNGNIWQQGMNPNAFGAGFSSQIGNQGGQMGPQGGFGMGPMGGPQGGFGMGPMNGPQGGFGPGQIGGDNQNGFNMGQDTSIFGSGPQKEGDPDFLNFGLNNSSVGSNYGQENDPEKYALQYARENKISITEAREQLRELYGDPGEDTAQFSVEA